MRLIDADKYPCAKCDVSYCYKNCDEFNNWFQNTVDAVPVVRCKDCVSVSEEFKGFYFCDFHSYGVKPDEYCSRAERDRCCNVR